MTNANVIVNSGTVIATYATNNVAYGLGIGSGAQLFCQGLANNANRIVQYNTVQEQAITNWSRVSLGSIVSEFLGVSPAATINCRFTDWSMPARDAPHLNGTNGICNPINLRDCQFHGGTLVSSYPTINLTNCLLERVYTSLWSADTNIPSLRNNLFRGGAFNFAPNVTNALVKDNLFDQTSITNNSGIYVTYNGGFNAFVTNNDRLQPTFGNDVVLTNSLAYQVGPLGNYYQPINSPLINAGSTTADQVGLYHYTVTTNEVVEGANIVSIGYHYVATDANGNPLDSNGNGIPDYIEDASGNGQPLTITLLAPTNNAFYTEPATIPIQASVFDWRSVVTNVSFYSGSIQITGITNAPYQFSWPIVAAGLYVLTATAQDLIGATTNSAYVNVTVTNLCGF